MIGFQIISKPDHTLLRQAISFAIEFHQDAVNLYKLQDNEQEMVEYHTGCLRTYRRWQQKIDEIVNLIPNGN